jgi:tetratricopeptide (TPR) repeat protein
MGSYGDRSSSALHRLKLDVSGDKELDRREQLARGWMLLADGKVATARRMFADIANEFWARFGLAEATLAAGHPDAAVAVFAEAEELLEDLPLCRRTPAIARRAVALARSGEPEYAAYLCDVTLKELETHSPADPQAVLWLTCAGLEFWPQERRAEAARRALAISESVDFRKAADTYHQLAATLRRTGHVTDAIAALDRAIELLARTRLSPGLGLSHLARAAELATEGAVAEAIDHAQRAQALCTDRPLEAMCVLADLYRRAMRFDEARKLAQHALDAARHNADIGFAARTLGQIAVSSSTPDAEGHYRVSADAFARAGKPLEVAETFRVLGRFLADRGQLMEAVSCFDQACATVLAPRNPRSQTV